MNVCIIYTSFNKPCLTLLTCCTRVTYGNYNTIEINEMGALMVTCTISNCNDYLKAT